MQGSGAQACGLHLLIFEGMGPGAGYAAAEIGGHPAGVHAAPGEKLSRVPRVET